MNSVNSSNINEELTTLEQQISDIDDKIRLLRKKKEKLVQARQELKDTKNLQKSFQLGTTKWNSEIFEWSEKAKTLLQTVFKMTDFRGEQLKVINAILAKEDVILLAPTGGGKSLCYQLPALVTNGFTLVISPLLSLMRDQVWNLKNFGVNAEMLSAGTDKSLVTFIYKNMTDPNSNMKLIYITPERLSKSKRFMSALQKSYQAGRLDRIAIDEVHVCSQWGHDYRPDYKYLNTLKRLFPDVPILGVTATATTKVILDVQNILNVEGCLVLKAPFNRPNLYYHVLEKSSDKEEVISLLEKLLSERYKNESGIIYTFSIKDADYISQELVYRGINVRPYHASQDEAKRHQTHSDWISGRIQAVVATVAFGMGINKPDVRFVIHHTMSKSIENYYQESGRAGRDGERAECILLYRFQDNAKITTMTFAEHMGLKNAYAIIGYCINGTKCRRTIFSAYFSETWNSLECGEMCDRCLNKDKILPREINVAPYCLELLQIIERAAKINVKLTGIKLLDAWHHKGSMNNQLTNIPKPKLNRYFTEQILTYLILGEYLKEDFVYTNYATISYVQRGSQPCKSTDQINFVGARILHLPEVIKKKSEKLMCVERVKIKKRDLSPIASDSDIIVVPNNGDINNSSSSNSSKRKSARSHVTSKSEESDSDCTPVKSRKQKEPKVNGSEPSSRSSSRRSSSKLNSLISELLTSETKRARNMASDDDVILVPMSTEIIELD